MILPLPLKVANFETCQNHVTWPHPAAKKAGTSLTTFIASIEKVDKEEAGNGIQPSNTWTVLPRGSTAYYLWYAIYTVNHMGCHLYCGYVMSMLGVV